MPLQHTDAINDNTENMNVNYNRIETIVLQSTIYIQFLALGDITLKKFKFFVHYL